MSLFESKSDESGLKSGDGPFGDPVGDLGQCSDLLVMSFDVGKLGENSLFFVEPLENGDYEEIDPGILTSFRSAFARNA